MKKFNIVLISAIAIALNCAPSHKLETFFQIEHERVFVAPLTGLEEFERLYGWPADSGHCSILLQEAGTISQILFNEFSSKEKFGLYETIRSGAGATVTVSPRIVSAVFSGDTLLVRITFKVTNTNTQQLGNIELLCKGLTGPLQSDTNHYQRIGLAITDLVRSFPGQSIVSHFYKTEYSINDLGRQEKKSR